MTRNADLILILTSFLLACTAARASIFCTWTKIFLEGNVHLGFVQEDPRQSPPSLRLYHSAWSAERTLLGCTWSDDAQLIQSYLSLCRERKQGFLDHPLVNLDWGSLFEGNQCVSLTSPGFMVRAEKRRARSVVGAGEDESSGVTSHRVKRGFIVPGTLWCGSGNKAPSFQDLGVFSNTDGCCREHDQCKHTILSFHSQFGVFNSNIFTMSHCDCDNKFRSCLQEANDRISGVVGYTFFNLLKMHCFTFSHQLQCAQRNWFGMCKETQVALYADVHPPTVFESAEPTDHCGNSSCYNTSSTSAPKLPEITISEPVKHQAATGQYADVTGSCSIYKELDRCKNLILPQQSKYGLHNAEPRTLYPCNCTARLFQALAQQTQMSGVQALLLEHVSLSCFLLRDCREGNTCAATVVTPGLPQPEQGRSGEDVEEQRHLQAVMLKVRRTNQRRAKRKDRPVRLFKLCLRMTRPDGPRKPGNRDTIHSSQP
ncbi:group 3 secretory phospholipase A2 [Cololabis saira]|uniref:group 3 secretory phospholipase A2 n=1 Tax=Cololabis saira TaxID=129043 RepID=UPI002AD2C07A|nr:group 3 secretory phospholipase A2 [Cololabis saira]